MRAMKTVLLSFTLLLLLVACQKEGPSPSASPPPPPTGQSQETPAATACQTDADCVASCARASECCDQLCPPCEQVFNRDGLAALMSWRGEHCAAVSCPMAKCIAPKEDSVAHCTAGQCTLSKVPAATP